MKLTATIGDIKRALEEEVRAGERAAMRAVRAETARLQNELRVQATQAFPASRNVANAWRARVFPRTGESMSAAGLVWTKVPNIVDAFERGEMIRAKNSRFLAIPTATNRQGGRRGAKPRVTPAQMVASGQAFLRPLRGREGFVWCLKVRYTGGAGRRRGALMAGNLVRIAGGRRRADRDALAAQGFVPMFILLPAVRMPKRLDVAGAARQALARLPQRFVEEWRREAP